MDSVCDQCSDPIPLGEGNCCQSCGGLYCQDCISPDQHFNVRPCTEPDGEEDDDDADLDDDEVELAG